jgi:hypothetical protein
VYDLTINGIKDFARYSSLLPQRKISRDPLSGTTDGTNTTFHTQFYPILSSGSLTVFNASGSVIATTSVDYDTGEVVLPNAPSFQPKATYTLTPYTQSQRLSFLISGFLEMQGWWVRDSWYLSSSSTVQTDADEDSTHIYIVKKDETSGSLTDPACSGSIPFSKLPTQIGFYMACCEYAFIKRQLVETSMTSLDFREGRGGVAVNRTQIPKNLQLALTEANQQLIRKLKAAFDQYYTGGEQFGGNVLPVHTDDYTENFEWQSDV